MKKVLLIFFGAAFLILAAAISYYMIAMSRLPVDDGDLGQVNEIEVPPERPGTQSLVLTGPIIRPLIFALDMSKPNIKSLDWAELKSIDLTAEVKIKATVGPDGALIFNPISDVRCPGHTKAGEMISRVLQTWAFKPYKVGPVTIRFNVGAIGRKLTIDISKLNRREGVDPDTPIKVGRLYMVENGLKRNEVKIISW